MKALIGFSENPLTTREWKVATRPGTRTRLHDDVGEGLPRAPEDVLEVPHQDPPVEVPLQGAEGHVRGHPIPPPHPPLHPPVSPRGLDGTRGGGLSTLLVASEVRGTSGGIPHDRRI